MGHSRRAAGERTAKIDRPTNAAPVELQLTQHDLAAMIGATRESVNKALSVLRDRGAVSQPRHHGVTMGVQQEANSVGGCIIHALST